MLYKWLWAPFICNQFEESAGFVFQGWKAHVNLNLLVCNVHVHDTCTWSTDILGLLDEDMNKTNSIFKCHYCVEDVLMECLPPTIICFFLFNISQLLNFLHELGHFWKYVTVSCRLHASWDFYLLRKNC